MNWNQAAIDRLKNCFPGPTPQGAVGQAPSTYLDILAEEIDYSPQRCDESPTQPLITRHPCSTGKCTRAQIRDICRDDSVDVLEAYAAAMAWGGQHRGSFRSSIHCTSELRNLLCQLRASKAPRMNDFASTQGACGAITGLGISYYTKLLYFFRPDPDAYILDQWTAKSVFVLTGNVVRFEPWGGPATNTTPQEYEEFCLTLEALGRLLGAWTGEQVEQALFDRRGGCWRIWVKRCFDDLRSASSDEPEGGSTPIEDEDDLGAAGDGGSPPPSPGSGSDEGSDDWLASHIAREHVSASASGLPLPPGSPRPPIKIRVFIGGKGTSEVIWFYKLNIGTTEIGVMFGNNQSARTLFNGLIQANGGSGRFGAAFVKQAGREISTTIPWGRNVSIGERQNVAETTVAVMSCIWTIVRQVAGTGGISHPQL